MEYQKIFRKSYLDKLYDDAKSGDSLGRYRMTVFQPDEAELLITPQIKKPEGLLAQMDPTPDGDFKSAVSLYEAYKSISPIQASENTLWESLAHNELFTYVQKRWLSDNVEDTQKDVLNHWFVRSHGLARQSLSSLWWLVYLSCDEQADNKYELTSVMFKNHTLRYTTFGASRLFLHKEATIGILKFTKEHLGEIISMENYTTNFTSYFNKLGATRQLAYLGRTFFQQEMENHFSEFLSARKTSLTL